MVLIENTLRWIREALADDPDCARWLKGAQDYSDNLLKHQLVAHGEFEASMAAFTGIRGSDLPEGYAAIMVNGVGAFFRPRFTLANGLIEGGTDRARAFILLHELAHGLLPPQNFENDFGDSAAQVRNDAKVLANCSKTIQRVR